MFLNYILFLSYLYKNVLVNQKEKKIFGNLNHLTTNIIFVCFNIPQIIIILELLIL